MQIHGTCKSVADDVCVLHTLQLHSMISAYVHARENTHELKLSMCPQGLAEGVSRTLSGLTERFKRMCGEPDKVQALRTRCRP